MSRVLVKQWTLLPRRRNWSRETVSTHDSCRSMILNKLWCSFTMTIKGELTRERGPFCISFTILITIQLWWCVLFLSWWNTAVTLQESLVECPQRLHHWTQNHVCRQHLSLSQASASTDQSDLATLQHRFQFFRCCHHHHHLFALRATSLEAWFPVGVEKTWQVCAHRRCESRRGCLPPHLSPRFLSRWARQSEQKPSISSGSRRIPQAWWSQTTPMPKSSSLQVKVLSSMPSEFLPTSWAGGTTWQERCGRTNLHSVSLWTWRLLMKLHGIASITMDKSWSSTSLAAALSQETGVPVSKIEESMEASSKTAENPYGGPYTAYLSGKSWDEASGETGSGKKFYHNVITERKVTSGLRGLRPRGRRSMCQVRVGRRCEGRFSRGACWWRQRVKSGQTVVVGGGLKVGKWFRDRTSQRSILRRHITLVIQCGLFWTWCYFLSRRLFFCCGAVRKWIER